MYNHPLTASHCPTSHIHPPLPPRCTSFICFTGIADFAPGEGLSDADRGGYLQRESTAPDWLKLQLTASQLRGAGRRRFKQIPAFHASHVLMRRAAWKQHFCRYLRQAATTILDRQMCLLLIGFDDEPMDLPNMPTCYDPESEAFIDAIVAEYLVTGVVEWYPAH
eukprot:886803-Rhodomonas_salina.1